MTKLAPQHPLHTHRRAGILLHPTSLPGPAPKGLIDHDAYRFVDFLQQSGVGVWQMLPLGPTHADDSPYQSLSAHAADTSLISLDWLQDHGLLSGLEQHYDFAYHTARLNEAHTHFVTKPPASLHKDYEKFIAQQADWLNDYALFMALREAHDHQPWMNWEAPLRQRQKTALAKARKQHQQRISFHQFYQFIFFQQWQELRQYANERDILIFGDKQVFN